MAKRLFIHVGPPKTGTTTVQYMLANNRDKLLEAGIIYPFEEPSHWRLALCSGLTRWPWTVEESDKPTWGTLRQISEANMDKDILLSSESFSYVFLSAKKEESVDFFKQIFGLGREIQILIYLRRQDLWLESAFIEYLKHFGEGGFETFFKTREEGLHYDKVLDFWANVAGKDRLTVKVYERSQMTDIREEFLNWIGIADMSGFRQVEDQNHRPSLLQIKVLYNYVETFLRYFPTPNPNFNKPYGRLDTLLGGFMYGASNWPSTREFKILPFELAQKVLADYEKGNARVAREYLGREDGRLFYDELQAYQYDRLDWPESLPDYQQYEISMLWQKTCEYMGLQEDEIPPMADAFGDLRKAHPALTEASSFSAERYMPEMFDFHISYEHWHRYLFATHFTEGKNVLDIACGEGYGSALLARNAAKVTGVDIDEETIQKAKISYSQDNLSFLKGSVTGIPVEGSAVFDVIVSFETIEHVDKEAQFAFLSEVMRLLRPGGIFLVSTPDKRAYSDLPEYHNQYHIHEFYASEFFSFLRNYFPHVEIMKQGIYTASYLHSESSYAALNEYNLGFQNGFSPRENADYQDQYMVAVCSFKPQQYLPHSLLFNRDNQLAQYDFNYQMLYFDSGKGFNETESLIGHIEKNKTTLHFDLSGFSGIKSLRFDPAACPVCLKLFKVILAYEEPGREAEDYRPRRILTNALHQYNNFYLFDTEDPQFYFELPQQGNLKSIELELEYLALDNAVFPFLKEYVQNVLSGSGHKMSNLMIRLNRFAADLNRHLQVLSPAPSIQEDSFGLKLAQQFDDIAGDPVEADKALESRQAGYKKLLKEKENHIAQLAKNLSNSIAIMQSLEGMLREQFARVKEKENKNNSLLKDIKSSFQSIEKLRDNIAELQTEIQEREKEIWRQKDDYKRLVQALSIVQAENEELQEIPPAMEEGNRMLEQKIGEMENSIYEKDILYAKLEKEYYGVSRYLDEVKGSLSFKLGWTLTAPFRWSYEQLRKTGFWLKFGKVAAGNFSNFFRHLNFNKIRILGKALKTEPPSLILANFNKLLSSPTNKIETSPGSYPPIMVEKQNEPLQEPVIHFFIDAMEELDFHLSIRGWIFSREQPIQSLQVGITQEGKTEFTEIMCKMDRPDVFAHYKNENALLSGFEDAVEKPFTGKVHLSLRALFPDGNKAVVDLGETEFREPYLSSYAGAIQANRLASPVFEQIAKRTKNVIALYTHSKGNYFFNEIKSQLAAGFRALGFEAWELSETDSFDEEVLFFVIIAPHEFFVLESDMKISKDLSSRLILLNTEQPSSIWFRKAADYFAKSIEVWDMNFYSWGRLWKAMGFARFLPLGFVDGFDLLSEVRVLPGNYCSSFLDAGIRQSSFLNSRFEERPIDILFVGHASARRQQFFAQNAEFFARYNCYFHLTDLSQGPVRDGYTDMNTRTAIGLAQRSKIVLNIHHGSHQYFEWHRMVMHGIWQRALVISETCGEGPPFVAGRHFVQGAIDNLPELIEFFLDSPEGKVQANEIIRSATDTLTGHCNLVETLEGFLQQLAASKKTDLSHSSLLTA